MAKSTRRPKAGDLTKYGVPAKPAGKPKFEITDAVINDVERLAGQGMTVEQIAWWLGCAKSTLDKYIASDIEVNRALEIGRGRFAADVTEKIKFKALQECDGDMLKFIASRRLGWTEASAVQNNIQVNVQGLLDTIPQDQLAQLLRARKESTEDGGASE